EFRERFEHATTRGDRRRIDKLQCRCGQSDPVVEKEPNTFFHTDRARAYAAVSEYFGDSLVRTLIFFPRANVSSHFDELASALFLKLRAHPRDLAARWNHHGKHSLARAPAHACVIEHGAARFDVDRVDAMLAHQPLRFLDPAFALFERDRDDIVCHPAQLSNRFRWLALLRVDQ